jgi:hypothetical protein
MSNLICKTQAIIGVLNLKSIISKYCQFILNKLYHKVKNAIHLHHQK